MNVVQIFNREQAEYKKFKTINQSHRDAHLRSIFYYAVFFPIVEVLSAMSIGLIVWYGGQGILAGKDITSWGVDRLHFVCPHDVPSYQAA